MSSGRQEIFSEQFQAYLMIGLVVLVAGSTNSNTQIIYVYNSDFSLNNTLQTFSTYTEDFVVGDLDGDGFANEMAVPHVAGYTFVINSTLNQIFNVSYEATTLLFKDLDLDGNDELLLGTINGEVLAINETGDILWEIN